MLSRGVRLNNPGNIRHGQPWQGLTEEQPDKEFCQFVSPEYGIRAICIVLQTYRVKYGLDTIAELIARWAPPNENDTPSYIKDVCSHAGGIDKDEPIIEFNGEIAYHVVTGIIAHENSNYEYDEETVWTALRMAGVQRL